MQPLLRSADEKIILYHFILESTSSGLVLDLGMMSPSSSEPEEEDLAAWGLARIKDAANQITESIDVPTLLLMQAAFVLGRFYFSF